MCLWLKRKVCGSTNNDESITEKPIKQHRKGHLMDADNTERATEPLIYQEHGETREEATNEESKPEPAIDQECENKYFICCQEGKLSEKSVGGVIMVSNEPFDDEVYSTLESHGNYRMCAPRPGTMKCKYIFHVSDMKILEDESKSGYAERVKLSLICLLDMAKQMKCTTVAMDTISFLDVKESAAMMRSLIFETGSVSEGSRLKKLYIVDDKSNLKSFVMAFSGLQK